MIPPEVYTDDDLGDAIERAKLALERAGDDLAVAAERYADLTDELERRKRT